MRKLMYLPSVALLAAAAPASSTPPPVTNQIAPLDGQQVRVPTGGGSPSGSPVSEDRKICRQLPSSSSRLPNRACLTAKEWKQVEDDLAH